MKIKQLRRVVAGLFPVEYSALFDRAYTTREIELVAGAFKLTIAEANKRAVAYAAHEAEMRAAYALLEETTKQLQEQLRERVQFSNMPTATVREPQEEVFLVPPTPGPATDAPTDMAGSFRNKIGLIKAVREVSGLGLKEAKDKIDALLDHGIKQSVFKGSLEKAAIAVRILAAAGGTTERKEAL